MEQNKIEDPIHRAGLFTMALRWVVGWTYFSAFWRRLVLDNKLIPEEAGYIGEKFNHFLPNALGIKPLIEYLVENPDALQTAMVAFTLVEALVGLFLILGLFSRLMSIGVFFLALGILLGSGWLGTTCLDEWQIGVLGVASGFTLFLTGSGPYSIDHSPKIKSLGISSRKWFQFISSGEIQTTKLGPKVLIGSIAILGLTLYTNQFFHGGVWGNLHNKSVKPKVEISNIQYDGTELTFQLFRVEGADVYGSFLIGMEIRDERNRAIKTISQEELANFPMEDIENRYVAKIKPGEHSLILPLGAKAEISLDVDSLSPGSVHRLILTDISGIQWEAEFRSGT